MVNPTAFSDTASLGSLLLRLAGEDDLLGFAALKDSSDFIKMTAEERKKWRAECLTKMQEVTAKSKEVNGWSLFMKFLSYFAGAFSIIAGSALAATGAGAVAGAALIVTGALTLGSAIAQEAGLTRLIAERAAGGNPQKAAKLLSQIDLGMAISTAILSIGTAIVNASVVATVAAKVVAGVVQGFGAAGESIGSIGRGVAEKGQCDAAADVTVLSAKVESSDRKIQRQKDAMNEKLQQKEQFSLADTFIRSQAERTRILFDNQIAAGAA